MTRAVTERSSFPLHLDLAGRPVTVVGGGPVAARKVRGLLAVGAVVTVVAPRVCPELAEASAAGVLRWVRRRYRSGDLDGAWLVLTATGIAATDEAVGSDAAAQRTFCVRADRAGTGTAATPAVIRRDGMVISVGADGVTGPGHRADPGRAVAARDALVPVVEHAVIRAVDSGEVPLRPCRPGPGRVVLIGAGAGDPDLLTVRAVRELAAAQVVVHDRDIAGELLRRLDPSVQLIDVDAAPGPDRWRQCDVGAVLVEHALAGRRVVRLTAEDPSVAARGSAVTVCRNAGIAVSIVPGVSRVRHVPMTAAVPVRHRRSPRRAAVLRA